MSAAEIAALFLALTRPTKDVIAAADLPDLPSTYDRHHAYVERAQPRRAKKTPVGWAVCSWCRNTRLCVHVHDLLICSRCSLP